jgi:hypothetical protein
MRGEGVQSSHQQMKGTCTPHGPAMSYVLRTRIAKAEPSIHNPEPQSKATHAIFWLYNDSGVGLCEHPAMTQVVQESSPDKAVLERSAHHVHLHPSSEQCTQDTTEPTHP